MRAGLVVVGVVLLVVGAALLFVPLIPQASRTVTLGHTGFTENLTGLSLTGSIAGSLSWSSNQTIEFWFASCPASNCTSRSISYQTHNGTSGTISFSYPSGTEIAALIAAGPPGSAATVKVTLTEPTYGTLLVLAGLFVLLVGVVLKRKPSPVPVSAPPASTTPTASRDSSAPSPTASVVEPPANGSK